MKAYLTHTHPLDLAVVAAQARTAMVLIQIDIQQSVNIAIAMVNALSVSISSEICRKNCKSMSGKRFKLLVAKVLAKHIPSHLQHKYRITYYIEWREYKRISFILWSEDAHIEYVVLRGLSEMFNSTEISITNYRGQSYRVADLKDEWNQRVHAVSDRYGMSEEQLFAITIDNADFTKVFTLKDDGEISDEAKRFELEE